MNKPQITCIYICALTTASAKKFERMFIYVLDGACCMKAKRIRMKGIFIGGGVLTGQKELAFVRLVFWL